MGKKIQIATAAGPAVAAFLFLIFLSANMVNHTQIMGPDSDSIKDTGTKGWNIVEVKPGEVAVPLKYEFKGSVIDGQYENIDRDSGTVVINNRSYYMTTIHKTFHSLVFDAPNDAEKNEAGSGDAKNTIKFRDVTFTFLRPPVAPGVGGMPQLVLLEFPDGSTEMLKVKDNASMLTFPKGGPGDYLPDGTHIFPDGTKEYGVLSPAPITTTLSAHTHPMAGLTTASDSVKLLVSIN